MTAIPDKGCSSTRKQGMVDGHSVKQFPESTTMLVPFRPHDTERLDRYPSSNEKRYVDAGSNVGNKSIPPTEMNAASISNTYQSRLLSRMVIPESYLEDPAKKKIRRRKRREARMRGAALGGAVAGIVVLGPVGMVLGFASGAAIAHGVSKVGERRKDARVNRLLLSAGRVTNINHELV